MITLDQAMKAVGKHCLIWDGEIAQVAPGKLRFETKFKYPDGGSIELYLVQDVDALPQLRSPARLTDLGETMTWLFHAQVKPWTSEKRRSFVKDVLELYGVEQDGGELVCTVSDVAELGNDISRLGQACLRISDLIFTKRMAITSSLVEQVESVLDDAEFSYAQDVEVTGRFGRPVRLDFVVQQAKQPPAGILTLMSTTRSTAHTTANEVFTKWYDVKESPALGRRLTVFDDRQKLYRLEDLERLEDVCDVVPMSDSKRLVSLLAEAA